MHSLAVAVLATLLVLGTPLSWKKTHLAEVNTWLGFVVHLPQVLMGNFSLSIGQVDAAPAMGMEDGHHHSGEHQDAGLHAAFPLQHAFRPVLPLPAKIFLVGL